MKNFVFNIGYDYSHITTVLAKEGVNEKTIIYLLMPSNVDDRQENTVRQLRTHLDAFTSEIELNKIEMYDGFQENLLAISDLLEDIEEPIISFSGGPRDHLVPLVIAASVNSSKTGKSYIRSDLDNSINAWNLPVLSPELEKDEKEIIEILEYERPQNINEIASKLGVSQSTASRKVKSLAEKDLVKIERKDKGKMVEPSIKALISL